MDYLIIFFIFIIFLALIIYGLPHQKTSINKQIVEEREKLVAENFAGDIQEDFETSATQDISEGASTFYDWMSPDFTGDKKKKKPEHHHKKCLPDDRSCLDGTPTYIENDYYIYPTEKEHVIHEKADCSKCDATKCSNIDRYVLKSSVPPCPDMSNYAPKSMVTPCPDMSKYIKKSQIPPCPQCPDMRDYVRKSEIPFCPKPVICPECPVCPPSYKDIQQDPRFQNWLNKFENEIDKKIDRYYIPRKECTKLTDEAYKKGVEKGKDEAYQEIAKEAGSEVANSKKFRKCLEHYDDGKQKHHERPSGHGRRKDYDKPNDVKPWSSKDYSPWDGDSHQRPICNYSGFGFPLGDNAYSTEPVC